MAASTFFGGGDGHQLISLGKEGHLCILREFICLSTCPEGDGDPLIYLGDGHSPTYLFKRRWAPTYLLRRRWLPVFIYLGEANHLSTYLIKDGHLPAYLEGVYLLNYLPFLQEIAIYLIILKEMVTHLPI